MARLQCAVRGPMSRLMNRPALVVALVAALGTGPGAAIAQSAPDRAGVTQHVKDWEAAMNDVDTNRIGDLTCDKYREREMANNESRIPTWDDLVKTKDYSVTYPKITQETVDKLIDAAKRKDAIAFRAASVEVVRENAHITVTGIDKINVVEGKQATATVTAESVWGNNKPRAVTSDWFLVYERDAWRYCNPVPTVRS